MSFTGDTGQGNSSAGRPPPLWRRLATSLLRWPFVVGFLILAIFVAKSLGQFIVLALLGVIADLAVKLRFTNTDVDIQDDVRALSDRRAIWLYRFCTAAGRHYFTAIFWITALLGAANWLTAALLMVTGLIVDALRARWSPDLRLDMPQIIEARPVPRRVGWAMLLPWFGFLAYMVVLLSLARPSRPDSLQDYMALFAPLHDLTASFLHTSRRFVDQLTDAGLPDRALIAAHVFAVCWLFVMVATLQFTSYVGRVAMMVKQALEASGSRKNDSPIWCMVVLLIFTVALYGVLFDGLSVDFTPRGRTTAHTSNGPYYVAVVWAFMTALLTAGLYAMLLNLRIALWRSGPERHAAAPDPSATSGS